jgi:predicted metal-dependent hydrolase
MSQIKVDQIIRSRRKTLSLEIAADARLVVRAPFNVKMDTIQNVLFKKRLWIQAKQKIAQKKRLEIQPKEFVGGESYLYLGKPHRLQIVKGKAPLVLQDRFYLSEAYLDNARQEFVRWYKEQALMKIEERVRWYAGVAGLEYKKITISDATRRWGSCSGKGNLRFNWRLVMAPLKVIDYVVVHELAHLQEKNHTRAFWTRVERILPGYKRYSAWLKDNQHLLSI